MQRVSDCEQISGVTESMEFYLTSPSLYDRSYEEKRKYNKRKSGQCLGDECTNVIEIFSA